MERTAHAGQHDSRQSSSTQRIGDRTQGWRTEDPVEAAGERPWLIKQVVEVRPRYQTDPLPDQRGGHWGAGGRWIGWSTEG